MATAAPTEKPVRKPRAVKPKDDAPAAATLSTSNNVGAISQVIGAVVDVTFEDRLPGVPSLFLRLMVPVTSYMCWP